MTVITPSALTPFLTTPHLIYTSSRHKYPHFLPASLINTCTPLLVFQLYTSQIFPSPPNSDNVINTKRRGEVRRSGKTLFGR
ncbi:hypothetical protein Pcinc_001585 [Petrolisthes cinctipes]|uniref:Uncharacterized protein n=1 Tax=Petrolisthes cinctipes TaxID=88211 RepID=A0AAE1L304_PETCI|nr:hypothetical protein Pcinc_001585 [Petrolisthes cinctipes]